MDQVSLRTIGADGYESAIQSFVAYTFPMVDLGNKVTTLENVMTAIISSGQLRYGPAPNPKSLVAMRAVGRDCISQDRPIPILVPFGSRKAVIDGTLDVAELMAIRQLASLQDRIRKCYTPGAQMVVRVEDTTGDFLFSLEPRSLDSVASTRKYCDSLVRLAAVLGFDTPESGLMIRRESQMFSMESLAAAVETIEPTLTEFLQGNTPAFSKLTKMGWAGRIPEEQREYYYTRYRAADPHISSDQQIKQLARYFACAWARIQLSGTGAMPHWNHQFLKLAFCPPVPGAPTNLVDRTVYYRTVPLKLAQTHMPAWRAKGYLAIGDTYAVPKLASWREEKDYIIARTELSDGEQSVEVQTDFVVV